MGLSAAAAVDDDSRRADLRAEIARTGRKIYDVAAAAGIHPTYLSAMLRGRARLTDGVEQRVRAVLQDAS